MSEDEIIDRVMMIDQWKTSGDIYTQDELNVIGMLLDLYYKQQKEIEELKRENLEIRDWKYVIDNPIDLDKLKELDLIKIKGKEYISKNMYDELEKNKRILEEKEHNLTQALLSKRTNFVSKDKIKARIEYLQDNFDLSEMIWNTQDILDELKELLGEE